MIEVRLTKPGLFITGTDTEVGKTVVTCAIAWQLRTKQGRDHQQGQVHVGVSKPISSGCRIDREGLVNEDAEALAHFADCRLPLNVINPIRYRAPVAPAVAADQTSRPIDADAIVQNLQELDAACDMLLIEGVGGLLVPLDADNPQCTVLDLIRDVGYPVLVVTRAGLGTLNHTALTVRTLRDAGCRVAGLVINGFVTDSSGQSDVRPDVSMSTNRQWLPKINRTPLLATVPRCDPGQVMPHRGQLPPAVLDAVGMTFWPDVLGPARACTSR